MANYVTLRKGQRATVDNYYKEVPDTQFRSLTQQSMSSMSMLDLRTPRPLRPAPLPPKRMEHAVKSHTTTRNLSQQSVSSVSMLDLRGPRTLPVRPAPLPPQKHLSPTVEGHYKPIDTSLRSISEQSMSMVNLSKQPARTPPRPPKRDSSSKQNIHKTNSGPSILNPIAEQVVKSSKRSSSKFSQMQKRLQARLTGDSVSDDENECQKDEEIPEPQTTQRYTYPTEKSQTLPRKFRIGQPNPDLNLPTYILKGPARSAPPPPKATNSRKMVYRRLPLVQTNKPAPTVPSRHKLCRSPPPPPPSIKTIPTKHTPPPPPFSRPDSSEIDQQESDIYELPGGCMPSDLEPKIDGFSKGRSLHTPLPSPPPPPIPPAFQVETADDIYEIPGNALAAAEAAQEQPEDDYTTMDFNPAMLYSTVKPKTKQKCSEKVIYSEMKLSSTSSVSPPPLPPKPLPPKPSHQPPVGQVPNPTTPDVELYEEYQSGNGDIYETL